jgi:lipoprotein-anchoring transpeptidase ErfK/SrfK
MIISMVETFNDPSRLTCTRIRTLMWVLMVTLSLPSAWAVETDTELRRQLAWQIALEGAGFSPGIVDGVVGAKTRLATREYQRVHGLEQTGQLDSPTAKAIQVDPDHVLQLHRIEPRHLNEIGASPTSWLARSKLDRLGHPDLEAALAEQYHCTRGLLRRLNPGLKINDLKLGNAFTAPQVMKAPRPVHAPVIEINLGEQVIRVQDGKERLIGLFHCSIAASKAKRPTGRALITRIIPNPEYTFRPEMWPEVTEKIDRPLRIPPGPCNPVGRCWIELSLPGYGIHGTPNPELIGKTGSHGCFRLTNWDALRLSSMVTAGTEVRFVE